MCTVSYTIEISPTMSCSLVLIFCCRMNCKDWRRQEEKANWEHPINVLCIQLRAQSVGHNQLWPPAPPHNQSAVARAGFEPTSTAVRTITRPTIPRTGRFDLQHLLIYSRDTFRIQQMHLAGTSTPVKLNERWACQDNFNIVHALHQIAF